MNKNNFQMQVRNKLKNYFQVIGKKICKHTSFKKKKTKKNEVCY